MLSGPELCTWFSNSRTSKGTYAGLACLRHGSDFRIQDANEAVHSLSAATISLRSLFAAELGFEPRYPPPEGGVLPLDDSAMELAYPKKNLDSTAL